MSTLSLGVLINMDKSPELALAEATALGLTSCQLVSWKPQEIDQACAESWRAAAEAAGVTVSLFWCGYSGRIVWNYVEGPATIGLVPPETREIRTQELLAGVQVAAWLGTTDLATHVGFLPGNPADADYQGTVASLKRIAGALADKGMYFDFETGQETPMVLRRCIADVGTGNLGVNLDPANLLMYGNANPVDSLDLLGTYVRGVHAKDGEYPTDGANLGHEKALGEGKVNFPVLVPKLKQMGYTGSLTIEREISGPQQIEDIKRAIHLLTPYL